MNLKLQSFLHQKGKYKEKAFSIDPFPIDKKKFSENMLPVFLILNSIGVN